MSCEKGPSLETGDKAYEEENYAVALQHLRPLAEEGNPEAEFGLGSMYYFGHGVPEDHREALKWYQRAARGGHRVSQYNVGLMYRKGEGVEEDPEEAAEWFRRAAAQGFARAQYSLAKLYRKGVGVPQDPSEALALEIEAAEGGHMRAQSDLGRYHENRGEYEEAFAWYEKAAEQGSAVAQFSLGILWRHGYGVEPDKITAHMWFNLAAAQGHDFASAHREDIERKMTREEIAAAQKHATEWLEEHAS